MSDQCFDHTLGPTRLGHDDPNHLLSVPHLCPSASTATAFNARRFLAALLQVMDISFIQVDGSEFRAKFEDACAEHGVASALAA